MLSGFTPQRATVFTRRPRPAHRAEVTPVELAIRERAEIQVYNIHIKRLHGVGAAKHAELAELVKEV